MISLFFLGGGGVSFFNVMILEFMPCDWWWYSGMSLACPLLDLNHSGSHQCSEKSPKSSWAEWAEKSRQSRDYKRQAARQCTLCRKPSWLASARKVSKVDALQNFTSLPWDRQRANQTSKSWSKIKIRNAVDWKPIGMLITEERQREGWSRPSTFTTATRHY